MVAASITVVQMLPELSSGGVERGTLELGRYLTARGHRSIVIAGDGRMSSTLRQQGSRHLPWLVGRKSPLVLTYLFPLRQLWSHRVSTSSMQGHGCRRGWGIWHGKVFRQTDALVL
jgi:hypothetical protein